MDAVIIIFTVVLTTMVTGFIIGFTLQSEIEDYYKKRIAGHKAAFTKKKKHYEIAKKIIRKGRDGKSTM